MKSKDLGKGETFEGSSPPAIFIGSKLSYPKVNVGVLSSTSLNPYSWIFNSPNHWTKEGMSISQIVDLRGHLINSRFQTRVSEVRKSRKNIRTIQELGMSSLQADVEVRVEKKPFGVMTFDKENLPLAKSAKLREFKILSNPKISQPVEKVYYDSHLKSSEALRYLYDKGYDEHALTQIISIGATGMAKNRKFVPTRNSITAVDDNIGKYLLDRIKILETIDSYFVYFGGHLGNYYIILMTPDVFSYELFELSLGDGGFVKGVSTDYESFSGRKEYASETAGGYYASRLSTIQKLYSMKKQASALVIRLTLPEYNIPLGVWVCRNSSRKSLESEPRVFSTLEEALDYVRIFIVKHFKVNLGGIFSRSLLIKNSKYQSKLTKYFI